MSFIRAFAIGMGDVRPGACTALLLYLAVRVLVFLIFGGDLRFRDALPLGLAGLCDGHLRSNSSQVHSRIIDPPGNEPGSFRAPWRAGFADEVLGVTHTVDVAPEFAYPAFDGVARARI
jgi:hypothetical protein